MFVLKLARIMKLHDCNKKEITVKLEESKRK